MEGSLQEAKLQCVIYFVTRYRIRQFRIAAFKALNPVWLVVSQIVPSTEILLFVSIGSWGREL